MSLTTDRPVGLTCEVTSAHKVIAAPATHIYGPECEAETGRLMYLCAEHAKFIADWRASHLNDPVECPIHGRIGTVRGYLILKEM